MWHKFLLGLARGYLRQAVRRRPPRPFRELQPRRLKRILVINATALGDWLFSTPALRALKESYPHWQLDVLIHPQVKELAAWNPHVTKLWLYPGRGPKFFRLLKDLARENYEVALILHGNDPEASLLAWGSGAPFLVGSAKSPLAFAYSAAVSPAHPLEHAIERRLNYARLFGAQTQEPHMELPLPAEVRARAREILTSHFGGIPGFLAALHPTGSAPYKWWPWEGYVQVGRHLKERYGAGLLVISGSRDRALAEALAASLQAPALVTGGRFSLAVVAGLLSHCRLFIGNDSGPLHMALALRVPALALLGADHPARIGPYRAPWGTYLYKKEEACPEPDCLTRRCPDNRCLRAITLADVLKKLEDWWEPNFSAQLPASPLAGAPAGQGDGPR